MMQRDKWTFAFTASKLADGAKEKKAHHEGRLKFWAESKGKVVSEVRESGIEISESLGASGSNVSRAYRGPQVMVRNDLQEKLSECHEKMTEHSGKVREYDGWIQVLNGNPEHRIDLNADDFLYFFG